MRAFLRVSLNTPIYKQEPASNLECSPFSGPFAIAEAILDQTTRAGGPIYSMISLVELICLESSIKARRKGVRSEMHSLGIEFRPLCRAWGARIHFELCDRAA